MIQNTRNCISQRYASHSHIKTKMLNAGFKNLKNFVTGSSEPISKENKIIAIAGLSAIAAVIFITSRQIPALNTYDSFSNNESTHNIVNNLIDKINETITDFITSKSTALATIPTHIQTITDLTDLNSTALAIIPTHIQTITESVSKSINETITDLTDLNSTALAIIPTHIQTITESVSKSINETITGLTDLNSTALAITPTHIQTITESVSKSINETITDLTDLNSTALAIIPTHTKSLTAILPRTDFTISSPTNENSNLLSPVALLTGTLSIASILLAIKYLNKNKTKSAFTCPIELTMFKKLDPLSQKKILDYTSAIKEKQEAFQLRKKIFSKIKEVLNDYHLEKKHFESHDALIPSPSLLYTQLQEVIIYLKKQKKKKKNLIAQLTNLQEMLKKTCDVAPKYLIISNDQVKSQHSHTLFATEQEQDALYKQIEIDLLAIKELIFKKKSSVVTDLKGSDFLSKKEHIELGKIHQYLSQMNKYLTKHSINIPKNLSDSLPNYLVITDTAGPSLRISLPTRKPNNSEINYKNQNIKLFGDSLNEYKNQFERLYENLQSIKLTIDRKTDQSISQYSNLSNPLNDTDREKLGLSLCNTIDTYQEACKKIESTLMENSKELPDFKPIQSCLQDISKKLNYYTNIEKNASHKKNEEKIDI